MDGAKEPMFAEERQMKIMSILTQEKKILVHDLCRTLNVSAVTVRNDLQDLEDRGLLTRTHGGAILPVQASFEENTSQKEIRNAARKKAIARAAAEYVRDGDTIAVDTGTSAQAFAACLVGKKNLTVITSDLRVALYLEKHSEATVILLGGTVRHGYDCTVGPYAEQMMRDFFVDKCFLGTNGITAERGLSTPKPEQAAVKRLMISQSNQLIVICDGEKFGRNSLVSVAPADAINMIVTDESAALSELAELEKLNIKIICVGEDEIKG